MAKKNCWEFKKCGREPGGEKVKELGVCPVALEIRINGVHEGKNAGRACWVVAGSLCKGQIQGTFAQKYQTCKDCEFYLLVKQEEGVNFSFSSDLLKKLT